MIKINLITKISFAFGCDQYTDMAFGNKNFLLNAVNYLCDDEGIAQVRSKILK